MGAARQGKGGSVLSPTWESDVQGMGNKSSKDRLSKEEIDFLKTNTHYDEDTINEWYKGFKQDCPDGHLDSLSFMKIYSKCFPTGNASEFCDHVFRTYDVDGNGWIDLPEMTKIVRSIYRMTGPKGGESYETPEV